MLTTPNFHATVGGMSHKTRHKRDGEIREALADALLLLRIYPRDSLLDALTSMASDAEYLDKQTNDERAREFFHEDSA